MHTPEFLGLGTVGERGQVSIPAEARTRGGIAPGDKLVFLSMHDGDTLVLVKAKRLNALFGEMTKNVRHMKRQVKKAVR